MKQIKKALSLVLCISMLFTMLLAFPKISDTAVMSASATTSFSDQSGDLSVTQPTKQQLLDMWNGMNLTAENYFVTRPSINAPYAIGELTDEYLQTGEDYLNYIRYTAHLPSIGMTDELNESAQYGAVLMAANDVLSHYPSQPSDMSDDFYQKGYAATTSSNISCGTMGYMNIVQSLKGCMNDRGANNLATVGHRRWLLNPTLKYVGFGYAEASYWSYVDTRVFDRSGDAVDYNFISWPPSGNCLNEVISYDAPFTLTLNPNKYKTPGAGSIKITVTRQSDGKVWVFDSTTNRTPGENKYMIIETSGYGVSNCVIFRPDVSELDTHNGVYTFSVSGLYYHDGTEATLNYKTDFFDTSYGEKTEVPDRISVKWSTDNGTTYGELTQNEFDVDTVIYCRNDFIDQIGAELTITASDSNAITFLPSLDQDIWRITFLKDGIYTVTVAYAENPEVYKEFVFYIGDYASDTISKGDVNADGEVDKRDYALIKRYCFDTTVFNAFQIAVADINGDGTVDKRDYALLKRACFGTYVIE